LQKFYALPKEEALAAYIEYHSTLGDYMLNPIIGTLRIFLHVNNPNKANFADSRHKTITLFTAISVTKGEAKELCVRFIGMNNTLKKLVCEMHWTPEEENLTEESYSATA
jgi:hypothetical protein